MLKKIDDCLLQFFSKLSDKLYRYLWTSHFFAAAISWLMAMFCVVMVTKNGRDWADWFFLIYLGLLCLGDILGGIIPEELVGGLPNTSVSTRMSFVGMLLASPIFFLLPGSSAPWMIANIAFMLLGIYFHDANILRVKSLNHDENLRQL